MNKFSNRSFKDVLHAVVFRSKIGPKEVAERTGISYGRLSNYCNENQDDSHVPSKHLVPLTLASSNTEMIEYLCFCVGGVFVPIPAPGAEWKIGDAREAVLEMVVEMGRLADEVAKAVSDNSINQDETANIEPILGRLAQRSIGLNMILAGLTK